MGGYGLPFFCLAVGAIRKDARGVAVAVAAAETVSEAACLSRFALWHAIMETRGERPTRKTQPPAEQRTRGRKTRAQQGLTKPAPPVGPAPHSSLTP